MFYFVKRLKALRIVTEPRTDCILLFGRFPVLLHYALYVNSFGRGKTKSFCGICQGLGDIFFTGSGSLPRNIYLCRRNALTYLLYNII